MDYQLIYHRDGTMQGFLPPRMDHATFLIEIWVLLTNEVDQASNGSWRQM